ncbi:flavin reductase family protein [Leucobacter soli]|uniref:flavin reductase family protein n=1 Tax=Leucobacter soli TaxID=2812850 RepID=UPI003609A8B0
MSENEAAEAAAWWRTVLGEFPTGVALVTTTDEQDEPMAMIVGSFVAVSQDPPMVGFLPVAGSGTFAALQAKRTFSVSVLGANHEMLSRAFGGRAENRFELAEWNTSPAGDMRVADALAWFDCELNAVHEGGDHVVVLADVRDYGVGDGGGGLPLLFLRGGYGTFAAPSERFDASDLSRKLRMVSRLRAIITELAEQHGVGVLLGALAGSRSSCSPRRADGRWERSLASTRSSA